MMRVLLAAAAAVLVAGSAWAQAFPTKAVTMVVPWPAGGSTDIAMRALAEASQKHLGQPIVIDNKPGASGTLGPATMAATAKPDGYTVAQMPITVFRLPYMQKTVFDPAKDFTYVIHITGYTFGVVVKADSPHKTFQDLMTFAKDNPGKVTYATPGAGTSLHITMEQIALKGGFKWTQVPFRGGAETSAAVLGGHVVATADSTGWAPLVNAGELRLLVTWGATRTKNWPAVPTLRETGIDMVSNSPFGIAGPKGMDPKAVQVLHDAFRKGMQEPSYLAAIEKLDMANDYMNTADYAKYVLAKIAEEKDIIEKLGLAQK
ncbi:MAG: tripartite tricarboxylate transporter substrate binding protein [Alphaproteobacteria bacterium]|nr:tripartite tricarboxylate transporter substrate binding protein [Alphaproteobacteria bacterium]